ncbi:hypothetical protein [Flavobacterium humi]|uniref:Lipoprotein n=1 Tax=Flavobacterium humi TaxID=2562683 RepID=A0A4Z0L6H5_9FLAO|nr:hypothetical protein [Flavobacterium humi]TGD57587.1 hypothetical protein E4635_10375 [Flavobacterium humi]
MKKFWLLIVVVFTFVGCDLHDDYIDYHLELLPVESADLPMEFKRDSIYELPFHYIRPSTCHVFEGFYYQRNSNTRTIAIQTSVLERNDCTTPIANPVEAILKFKPTTEDSYIFKMWKGEDDNGEDVFEEVEIPVVP